jgi:hypothetical protein
VISAQEELDKYIDILGLAIDCKFKPWDGDGEACLKWDATLKHRGSTVLACEYTAGIGHCPSYPAAVAWDECRRGVSVTGKAILPHTRDFVQSLCIDSDALSYAGFECWARDLGYDTDSRKAEAMYRKCLDHGIRLRAAIGGVKFDQLCYLASQL